MAGVRDRRKWDSDDLKKAIEDVQEGRLSIRRAALKYGVPKSTLHDHASHRVEPLSRPGPPPVLSREEENDLEQWIIKMSEIGYGRK